MHAAAIHLIYLAASACFILGLRGMTHPRSAVRGNLTGALGMLLAVVATLMDRQVLNFETILVGLAAGAAIGAVLALRIQMTAMPQMVALLNGFGGFASVLVAATAILERAAGSRVAVEPTMVATAASGIIGAVTFSGSLVAFAKLQGLISEKSWVYPGQQWVNGLVAIATLTLGVWFTIAAFGGTTYGCLVALALALGVLLTVPIGGADMPVVIALLNSYSGLAAAATGFVLGNNVLIIAGSLVGASGMILTRIMCAAMNRSLFGVLCGFVDAASEQPSAADAVYAGRVKSVGAEEVAMLLDGIGRVVIVPGYGMAVSQAQHSVAELVKVLEGKGTEVEFAIHPVAGRMPGQMNVLLAEAGVGYDKLKDLDEINPTFPMTDVTIVIGANDVVNPLARTQQASPIMGMPILDADKSRTVIVIKRSLSAGFAGVANSLFAAANTMMLFGDANKVLLELIRALKE